MESSPKFQADKVEIVKRKYLDLLSSLIPPGKFEIELFSASYKFDLIRFDLISLS